MKALFEAQYDFDGRDLDWSQPNGHWLVAETEQGGVIAALLVVPSKPFGFMEWLIVNKDLNHAVKARATLMLTLRAQVTLHLAGSQVAVGFVSSQDESWNGVAERRGWVPVFKGHLMLKALESTHG